MVVRRSLERGMLFLEHTFVYIVFILLRCSLFHSSRSNYAPSRHSGETLLHSVIQCAVQRGGLCDPPM